MEASYFFSLCLTAGNPPYQANLGGASALPVYHYFVLNAKELKPKYISMITPARWFNTGTGLDSFREEMLHDTHISVLHDFIDATECFTNVEIKGGIEFFLWDKSYDGKCNITTHKNGAVVKSLRYLVEEGMDSYIRNSHLISLLNKVKEKKEPSFADLISSRDPFGYDIRLPGSMKVAPHKYSLEESEIDYIKFYYNGWRKEGIGYVTLDSVNANKELIDKYKILIPKAWGTGREGKDWLKPFIVSPPSVCTETYLVVGGYDNIELAQNVVSYMQTKLFHVLVSLLKISQNAAKGVYQLVPQQDFSKPWTDEELYAKYGLTDEEIAFIESTIKPME